MADRSVARSFNGTLPLMGAADRVTPSNETCTTATVYNRSGVTAIYVRLDGNDPSGNGANDGDLVVPAGGHREFSVPYTDGVPTENGIRLAGTSLPYSIEII